MSTQERRTVSAECVFLGGECTRKELQWIGSCYLCERLAPYSPQKCSTCALGRNSVDVYEHLGASPGHGGHDVKTGTREVSCQACAGTGVQMTPQMVQLMSKTNHKQVISKAVWVVVPALFLLGLWLWRMLSSR